MPYPAVFLHVPLGAESLKWLAPLSAVGELKQTGKRASVLNRVSKDGILEVDPMRSDTVVLIHPTEEMKGTTVSSTFESAFKKNALCSFPVYFCSWIVPEKLCMIHKLK